MGASVRLCKQLILVKHFTDVLLVVSVGKLDAAETVVRTEAQNQEMTIWQLS